MPDDTLLDAARECVLEVGVRRTTLSRIARTAGVSRMTLYRRFPDVTSALTALMTREFGRVLNEITPNATSARDNLVRGTIAAVRALVANPLLRAVLDKDAEVLLPYIVRRLGSTQRHAEAFLDAWIRKGHTDASVRAGRPEVQTRAVLLIAQSFVLSMRPASSDIETTQLLSELEHTLDATLRPDSEEHPR